MSATGRITGELRGGEGGNFGGSRTHRGTCRWPAKRTCQHFIRSKRHVGGNKQLSAASDRQVWVFAYLVRKSQGKLDLVRGNISVASAGQRGGESSRASPEGSAGNTEGVHYVRRVVDEINGAAVSTKTVAGVRFAASIHPIYGFFRRSAPEKPWQNPQPQALRPPIYYHSRISHKRFMVLRESNAERIHPARCLAV